MPGFSSLRITTAKLVERVLFIEEETGNVYSRRNIADYGKQTDKYCCQLSYLETK